MVAHVPDPALVAWLGVLADNYLLGGIYTAREWQAVAALARDRRRDLEPFRRAVLVPGLVTINVLAWLARFRTHSLEVRMFVLEVP